MQKSSNIPGRKMFKKKSQQTYEIIIPKQQPNSSNNTSKNRYSIYTNNIRQSQQTQNIRSINRKTLEVNNNTQPIRNYNNTINTNHHHQNSSKPVYRRVSYYQKNQTTTNTTGGINQTNNLSSGSNIGVNVNTGSYSNHRRYEEQIDNSMIDLKNRASPYLKKQRNARNSIINRSSNPKFRSGNLTKQLSPHQLLKQPRSSLSQHYDPTLQTSLHKRRKSYIDEKNQTLKQAKEYYKDNNFDKCCDFLRKHLLRSTTTTNTVSNNQSAQGYYLLGMSLINKNDLKEGIEALGKVIQVNPYFKKTLYLILGLAYKKLQNYKEAISILTKGLELFPDYYDCLVYRGKMQLKLENYDLAKIDFTDAIELNPKKGFAYLGKGTCETNLNQVNQAITTFTEGIKIRELSHVCYEKRGICYYELNQFTKALQDFEQAIKNESYNSPTAHFYKGMIYYNQYNKPIESVLCFEETLKSDQNIDITTQAVEMMLKVKIEEKDFYEANHIISRTENLPNVHHETINHWKLFLEASLFLMKKKYKDGIETYLKLENQPIFSITDQKQFQQLFPQYKKPEKQRYKFLKPLIHLYKAFGYLSQNQPESAQEQYQKHTFLCQMINQTDNNLSKHYNSLVINATKLFPTENITQILIQARQLIPTKPQPYLFISFDILNNKLLSPLEEEQNPSDHRHPASNKQQYLEQILQNLTTGISHLPQLSNNHISSFYYYRSIIYLYQHQFNKAVLDIDKAIEKSQDNIAKYFYLRGLIFACFGNFSQSIQDLSVAINLDEKYPKPYLERAKCLQIEGNSNEAFIDLQKYITLSPEDPYIHKYAGFLLFQNCAYEDCLSAFSHGSEMPNDRELTLTKGKCHFLLGDYEKSLELFEMYQKETNPKCFKNDVQVIRICQELSEINGDGNEDIDCSKDSSPSENSLETLNSILKKLNQITNPPLPPTTTSPLQTVSQNELQQQSSKIFKLRDIHQLKGSIYLLQKQPQKAMKQFKITLQLFRAEKQKQLEKNVIEDNNEEFEEEWSQIEIKYNMSICLLYEQKYEEAFDLLKEFENSTEKGKNWDAYISIIEGLKEGKGITKKSINTNPLSQIDTFQQNHRISKLWPRITIPLPSSQSTTTSLSLSLAFSYPFVQPPEMMPQFDSDLFTEFDIRQIQPKPQAPWINRNQTGLVFTPNIQNYDNLQLSMTTKKQGDDNEQSQLMLSQNEKPSSELEQSISLSHSDYPLEADELKKKFKLDSLVEMKLKKMIKSNS